MPTSWTQADITKLELAIANGSVLQSMTFADQTFNFRSMDEMLKLLAVMRQSVSGSGRVRLAATRKGA